MPYKNIGYHTRLLGQNSVKCVGGSFGGSLNLETANRLVRSHFTVTVKPSGRAVFVDREGREVSLYMAVDPEATEAGKAAIAADRAERARLEILAGGKQEYIEDLLAGMSSDEAIHRLTKND